MKDLTKLIQCFTEDVYSSRSDLTFKITKTIKNRKPFYNIHILVHIKVTDGLYTTINKGIDRNYLRKEIQSYFNLGNFDFSVTYQNVYPETIY
jgi:hypothetical protein